jgi:2-hydroxychromene-2-carboxylate isomerase/predicted thioesterase
MKPIPIGARASHRILPTAAHTAAAVGNPGVHVVSTPALIGFLEDASHLAIEPYYDSGEASVGTKVEIEHLAPAHVGLPLELSAEVTGVKGRRIDFKVEARQEGRLVMAGRHQRAVVDLARFLGAEQVPAAQRPRIDFWFDFHSPWCYLASTRIGDVARRHGADLRWRPVHLAKLIDRIDGRRPLEGNPAFVRWYKQDLLDQAALLSLPFRPHPDYPLRPSRALRTALWAAEQGKAEAFVCSLMRGYWSEDADITDIGTLARYAAAAGLEPAAVREAATGERTKQALDANLEEAIAAGLFGLPTAVLDGKLFWGNDHIDLLEIWLRRRAAG